MITVNAKFLKGICTNRLVSLICRAVFLYKRLIIFTGLTIGFFLLLFLHYKSNIESFSVDLETINTQEETENLPISKKFSYRENYSLSNPKNFSISKSTSPSSTKDSLANEAIWSFSWNRCNLAKKEPDFNLRNGKFLTKEKKISLSNKLSCYGDIYLVVIVFSNVADIKLRNQIRESWASINNFNGYRIGHYFVTPEVVSNDKTNNNGIVEILESEREEHNDIIQLNITFSVREKIHAHISAMETALHLCPVAQYVAIVDSDTFVNSPNIVNLLASYSEIHESFLMCNIKYNIKPERQKNKSLFMSTAEFRGKKYPPHCGLQDGYIASMRSMKLMLSCYYQMHRHLWYDNLYIGALLPKKLLLNVEHFWNGYTSLEMHQHYINDMSEFLFLTNGDKLQKRLWVKFVQSSLLNIM